MGVSFVRFRFVKDGRVEELFKDFFFEFFVMVRFCIFGILSFLWLIENILKFSRNVCSWPKMFCGQTL